jgi:L-threonylcarbamoyladenylate synthase
MVPAAPVINSDAASRPMDDPTTLRLPPDPRHRPGRGLLRAGGLVAFPTETVYGLGADARSDLAVARIFAAKGRPRFNPLIVHVASATRRAQRIARFTPEADSPRRGLLARAAHARPAAARGAGIAPLVTAGLPTVALRVPAHPLARELLAAFGGPVAAPSANPSGKLSPTRAEDVLAGLRAGSTRCSTAAPARWGSNRPSSASMARPSSCAPAGFRPRRSRPASARRSSRPEAGDRPVAPGQLASHYAPEAALRLNAAEAGRARCCSASDGSRAISTCRPRAT